LIVSVEVDQSKVGGRGSVQLAAFLALDVAKLIIISSIDRAGVRLDDPA
jgi:hypothetical protein